MPKLTMTQSIAEVDFYSIISLQELPQLAELLAAHETLGQELNAAEEARRQAIEYCALMYDAHHTRHTVMVNFRGATVAEGTMHPDVLAAIAARTAAEAKCAALTAQLRQSRHQLDAAATLEIVAAREALRDKFAPALGSLLEGLEAATTIDRLLGGATHWKLKGERAACGGLLTYLHHVRELLEE